MKTTPNIEKMLSKSLVICDDTTWIWQFINTALKARNQDHIRLNSNFSLRTNWKRFGSCKHIILLWENKFRPHGSIIEEIRNMDPTFNVGERLIIITTSPSRQDVVYFHELGVYKIIRAENEKNRLESARAELAGYIDGITTKNSGTIGRLHRLLDIIMQEPTQGYTELATTIQSKLTAKNSQKLRSPILDIEATLAYAKGDFDSAILIWERALDCNPNYFRAMNNLIQVYRRQGETTKAITLMKRMHQNNNRHIGRLTNLGESYLETKNSYVAEGFFTRAVEKDRFCDSAKAGLAEVKFLQGDLVKAKQLLKNMYKSDSIASALNKRGVDLVKSEQFKDALKHYIQAHYILPDQSKSALIFFNIGLCYSRWGDYGLAEHYLRLALIKDPTYTKAKGLLQRISGQKPSEPKVSDLSNY